MDPDRIVTLIQRLPDDSMLSAHLHDADDWMKYFGWGADRQLAAAIHDLETILVRGSINWVKGKEPKIPPWDRPWDDKKPNKQEQTPDEEQSRALLMQAFSRFGGGGGKLGRL